MLATFLFTAFLIIRTAPDSFLGRALSAGLVLWPAARLSRITRGQLVCWLGLALTIWAAVAIAGADGMAATVRALPEAYAWMASFEISILVDALIATALFATQVRFGALKARLRMLASGRRARPRPRAPRRRRPASKPAGNDGDPDPAFALAA